MQYDFSSILERAGRDALAFDSLGQNPGFSPDAPQHGFSAIPMWVADMNFQTAPSVTRAIQKRTEHAVYGYFSPSDDYYASIIKWQKLHFQVDDLKPEYIGYENGVLGGLISALTAFTAPGDPVLLHSPVYVGFTKSIENAGRHIIHTPLKPDADGIYRMDFADMEEKLRTHKIHAAIFCSPHNPCGRVWERWEIEKAMELYRKYDCIVISDEIWSDILLDGHHHIPTHTVSDDAKTRTVSLYAPSKTFNLAGLIGSYHIIYDAYLRDRVRAQSSKSHYNSMNVLSMHALIGAYQEDGYQWTEELCRVLSHNLDYAYQFIHTHFPSVFVSKPQGTYMLFLDCTQWCLEHNIEIETLLKRGWEYGVAWQDGRLFKHPCALRVNCALPMPLLEEALHRMKQYIFI